jgi:glycerol-3-phosphate acyltransferase PlsY
MYLGWVVIKVVLALLVGYLLGSANTSLIVGKFYGVDVRKHGSGNAGMTNTLRTLGKLPALLVIIGDLLKGILACVVGYYIFKSGLNAAEPDGLKEHIALGVLAGGTGAVLGHNWPLYFGFKGGKGVLTTFAVILMAAPIQGLILLGIFLVVVALTRYVSLGSITAAAVFPFLTAFMGKEPEYIVFAVFVALLVILRHGSNITRLIKGTENKLGHKKGIV